MNVLMVITSHDQLGDTGEKTGFWLEELAAPYYVFKDAGAEITLASPKGGQPPLDPKSSGDDFQTDATRRFNADSQAQTALASTVKLAEVTADGFDAVFYPGGHGPLWDLAEDPASIKLIESAWEAGKTVGSVCHAPGVLRHAQVDNQPLVANRQVTGFSNSEEDAMGLTDIVPFLVESELKEKGGHFAKGDDWSSFVQVDGRLITGQNPMSSVETAEAVIESLR